MNRKLIPAVVTALVLAACGGGGGGGGTPAPTAATPPATSTAVQINDSSVQAVAAHALDTVQNTSTQGAASFVAGVEVQATADTGIPVNLVMAELVGMAAGTAATSASLASGVAIDQTANCPGGGTLKAVGSVASETALSAGDSVTLSAANCSLSVNGATATMNGSLTLAVTEGTVPDGSTTFHVVMHLVASNFTVTSGSTTASIDGDMAMDLARTGPTSATLVTSGTALSSSLTTAGATRGSTWTTYRQGISMSGSSLASTLDGTIRVTNTRLAIANATYQISTPTPVQWTSGFAPTSGSVNVAGAANSRLRLTFTSSGVTIDMDANGDGVYEKTVNTTVAALRAQL